MEDKVLEALQDLGFKTEKVNEVGYSFFYETYRFMFIPDKNDRHYLTIGYPIVLDKEKVSDKYYYQTLEVINSQMKYIKAFTIQNSLWIFYERYCVENENLADTIEHMVKYLEEAIKTYPEYILQE